MANSAEQLFAEHKALLEQAVGAIATRGYWTPYAEMPSPKAYGENANEAGKAAFEARLHKRFELDQAAASSGARGETGGERSPYGFALEVRYPRADVGGLVVAAQKAGRAWAAAGPEAWAGVTLEILKRLNRRSFEIAYAVMHTTGQAFMMAFQAGGPHAQDRG